MSRPQTDESLAPIAAPAEGDFLARLEVLGRLEMRDVVLRTVSAVCRLAHRRAGAPESTFASFRAQLVSAVGEAFNNVALHAYEGKGGHVDVKMWFESGELVLEICDWGKGFDPMLIAEPNLEAMPESGLGVFIIKSFVDSFVYLEGKNGAPNILRLRKRVA